MDVEVNEMKRGFRCEMVDACWAYWVFRQMWSSLSLPHKHQLSKWLNYLVNDVVNGICWFMVIVRLGDLT